VELGLAILSTDYSLPPAELGRLAEERGFESLFFAEHTHIPASRETPYPRGGELPRQYSHTLDPFVACAMAAAVTERLRIGTGVCLVVERDPIITAKEVATIDLLSGGRFEFGVGAGWVLEEMRNHGTDPRRRFALMRERVEAMQAIWTQEEASYEGKHVSFERIWSWPKPVQKPYPPVLIGGGGDRVLARVVRYADGWFPLGLSPDELRPRIEELGRLAHAAGRDRIPVTLFGAKPEARALERLSEAGVARSLLWLDPERDVARQVDELARLVG
jgi:probable F420-dependent oxidoreductase